MERIAVLSGAGISAESGLATFRDSGGLWERYRVEDVATPEAWAADPSLVLRFYNGRLEQARQAIPNDAHLGLVALEKAFHVDIITQNVDDLHERAGSTNVLHLHGELNKCRSTRYENDIFDMPAEGLKIGDFCAKGTQLRPHIVWFGEMVPAMEQAEKIVQDADLLLVVGTSLNVYPAAGLVWRAKVTCPIWVVDPGEMEFASRLNVKHLRSKASKGVPEIVNALLK